MRNRIILLLLFILVPSMPGFAADPDAKSLVADSFNYMRGRASISTVDMTVHRPDWERVTTIKAWTIGEKTSLFLIVAPPKDKGNGTLKKGRYMWTYNPKVNRAIKLPPSMMSQAWQGSDFSNNDLAKSDTLINDFTHYIEGTTIADGKKVYIIKSIPKPDAPVVWGMLKLKIRQDLILLEESFFDEDFKLVKTLTTREIKLTGGRLYPVKWKMQKAGAKDEYTRLAYRSIVFKETLPQQLFSLSNLKNAGR
ncbi:MAG: outer membrane lipoprotein-sorting protein [Deltaproteobacteria bacterium]|nr:outer membrane lipoprotein-sorting protein [Deltaproteobacteria bacterium]